MTFNMQRVLDYISGNDIPEDELEMLEDNEEFMLKVLQHTKDKKTAFYASDRLLGHPSYIRKVVELFKDDLEFVIKLVEKHEKKANYELDGDLLSDLNIAVDELDVVLSRIYDKTQDDRLMKYKMNASQLTNRFQLWVMLVLMEEKDIMEEIFDENENLRFQYMVSAYLESPILTEFHLTNIVDDILYDDDFTLEELIHYHYSGVSNPEEISSLEMLLSVIDEKDPDLSEYLMENPQYLGTNLKNAEKIKRAWQHYLEQVNFDKVEYIIEKYQEFDLEFLDCRSRAYYMSLAIEKLGLQEFFSHFDNIYYSYKPSDEILKEDVINDYLMTDPDQRLRKDEFEQLFNEAKALPIDKYAQEFIDSMCSIITETFKNDLPVDKIKTKEEQEQERLKKQEEKEQERIKRQEEQEQERLRKQEERRQNPLLTRMASGDDAAIIEVDFTNKKVLRMINTSKNRR